MDAAPQPQNISTCCGRRSSPHAALRRRTAARIFEIRRSSPQIFRRFRRSPKFSVIIIFFGKFFVFYLIERDFCFVWKEIQLQLLTIFGTTVLYSRKNQVCRTYEIYIFFTKFFSTKKLNSDLIKMTPYFIQKFWIFTYGSWIGQFKHYCCRFYNKFGE